MYDRFGRARHAWYDPFGWAGLDKQVPPNRAAERALNREHAIAQRQRALAISIQEKARQLRDLGTEAEAVLEQPHLKRLHQSYQIKINLLSAELNGMRAQQAADGSLLDAVHHYSTRLAQGYKVAPRAHLRRAHHPTSALSLRLGRVAEAWAAASIGIMLLAFVAIVLFARQYLLVGVVSLISMVAIVEAVFRRQLGVLIAYVTNALAIVAALVLLYEFFWEAVITLVLVAGAYIMWENLRELWS
jgi:hypothetical protein